MESYLLQQRKRKEKLNGMVWAKINKMLVNWERTRAIRKGLDFVSKERKI